MAILLTNMSRMLKTQILLTCIILKQSLTLYTKTWKLDISSHSVVFMHFDIGNHSDGFIATRLRSSARTNRLENTDRQEGAK